MLLPALLAAALATLAAAQPRVEITLGDGSPAGAAEAFGVGGRHRPGEDVGIRVTVRPADGDFGAATNILLQWEVPNADGDIAEVRRVVALTAGGSASTWLYATLPPDLQTEQTWTVRGFLYDADAGDARGAEVGTAIIQAPVAGRIEPGMSVIGRLGARSMGLDGYQFPSLTGQRSGEVIPAHEDTLVVPLRVADLPDAWPGLMSYDALVWADEDPGALTARQEEAIRDWITGGGHLVIVLPFDGNPWRLGDAGGGPLGDLLPSREPRLEEDVPLRTLLPTLSKSRRLGAEPLNDGFSIKVFDDLLDKDRGLDPGFAPLIATEDARVIAITRPVGHGHLSLIGLPLAGDTRFSGVTLGNGLVESRWLPQADAFWNRILGRRAATPSTPELAAMPRQEVAVGAPSRRLVDGGVIADAITMRQQAGAGLLLAVVLFLAYWLLAGPVGFAVLKARGRVRHAWVAFVLAAAIFTGLAWVGVTALRKRDVDVRHFTVLDWVADDGSGLPGPPQLARATSWMNLYLPNYGSSRVGIAGGEASGGLSRLSSWVPSGRPRPQPFPNADRYAEDGDGRAADPVAWPARATVTQLRARWRGPLDVEWGGMLRVDPEDPLRVEIGGDGEERLAGGLLNGLPAAIRDVSVIWVRSDRLAPVRYLTDPSGRETPALPLVDPDRMVHEASMWTYTGEFAPGGRIPLGVAPSGADASRAGRFTTVVDEWMKPFESEGDGFGLGAVEVLGRIDPRRLMAMASVFNQLPAPAWRADTSGRRADTVQLSRLLGRELDLSPWFRRPCVIVLGTLEQAALPVPLEVDGRRTGGSGTVFVRWVMPLDGDPARTFRMELTRARAEDGGVRRPRWDRVDRPASED